MKKGEIYEGVIDKVVFPNKGIIFVGEDTVTVKNGIPGQRIRFQINKNRGGRWNGAIARLANTAGCCSGFSSRLPPAVL
mgnify:CR=1 FL=1